MRISQKKYHKKLIVVCLIVLTLFLSACLPEKIGEGPASAVAAPEPGADAGEANAVEAGAVEVGAGEANAVEVGAGEDGAGQGPSITELAELPSVSQLMSTNVQDIMCSSHERSVNEPLYDAAFPHEVQAVEAAFSKIDPSRVMDLLPGDFQLMSGQERIYQNSEGAILGAQNDLSFNYRHPRARKQLDTLLLYNAYSLKQRRVKTLSLTGEFAFMTRESATQYSQEFFHALGYENLILRSCYAVYELESGDEFYFIQWMQGLQGVPVLDDDSLWFVEQDSPGVFSQLECIIDAQGLSYLRASSKLELLEEGNPLPLISRDEALALVKSYMEQALLDKLDRRIESLELVWSSVSGKFVKDTEPFALHPYYLAVVREDFREVENSDQTPNFVQYILDASSGALQ